MRRSLTAAVVIAAGITSLAVAAGPAFAANGNTTSPGTCTGTGTNTGAGTMNGQGQGRGMGSGSGMGMGMSTGTHITAASGTLTAAQKVDLLYMVEEEKLAHDVYAALAIKYPADVQFSKIVRAEAQHQAAVRTLLVRYGLTDPTAGLATGEFATASFQALYGDLLADATNSVTALGVGIAIEKLDIADLRDAKATVTAPDVVQVYTNLLAGSERHLVAFGG
ncbi:MAG: DUF2202 domain-containing protein, partial [Actinobacteria bacterium]|nr:DUF2202 domain-containing protein [Actinomycetota bacterium]